MLGWSPRQEGDGGWQTGAWGSVSKAKDTASSFLESCHFQLYFTQKGRLLTFSQVTGRHLCHSLPGAGRSHPSLPTAAEVLMVKVDLVPFS